MGNRQIGDAYNGSADLNNYDYIGSGTPTYYENFSTKLKSGTETALAWSSGIETFLIGATAMLPFLAPFTAPLIAVNTAVNVGLGGLDLTTRGTDWLVDKMDMKGDINKSLESRYNPERYRYKGSVGEQIANIAKTAQSTVRNSIERSSSVMLNNDSYGDKRNSYTDTTSNFQKQIPQQQQSDRYGNAVKLLTSI